MIAAMAAKKTKAGNEMPKCYDVVLDPKTHAVTRYRLAVRRVGDLKGRTIFRRFTVRKKSADRDADRR